MKANLKQVQSIGLVLLFCLFTLFAIDGIRFLAKPVIPLDQTVDYVLNPGATIKTLAADLQKMGYLRRPYYFIWLARLTGQANNLQAGEYLFAAGTKPFTLIRQIATGKVLYHDFTIVEGWTFQQMMDALNNNSSVAHTLTGLTPGQIMAKIGHSDENPEGRFYPDTYRFSAGTADTMILQRAYRMMADFLKEEWQRRDPGLPYLTPYDALIAASLVEKETAANYERPKVAGVMLQRIRRDMPLQIDSTIIYGLGKYYTGKLRKENMRMDTPYNTYLHKGFPPTPIAMPSRVSISAVLHPQISSALYFVARGDGSHQFSNTLAEHQEAIDEFLGDNSNRHFTINKRPLPLFMPTFPRVNDLFTFKITIPPICSKPWYQGSVLESIFFNRCVVPSNINLYNRAH